MLQEQDSINFTDGETKALNNKYTHQGRNLVKVGLNMGFFQAQPVVLANERQSVKRDEVPQQDCSTILP